MTDAASGNRTTGEIFPPPGVKGVVFDVVGTVIEPVPSVAEAYRAVGIRHGIDLDLVTIRRRFREGWLRQEDHDGHAPVPHATNPVRESRRWREIIADVFAGNTAQEAIFADLWRHFASPEAWRTIEPGRRLMEDALAAGKTVALASNFDERLRGIAAAITPLDRVRHVFASSEIGWRKPAIAFFRRIEERLGLSPHELVLVGDDPRLDLAAGRLAGWQVHPVGTARRHVRWSYAGSISEPAGGPADPGLHAPAPRWW